MKTVYIQKGLMSLFLPFYAILVKIQICSFIDNITAFGNPHEVYSGGLLPREGYDEFFDVRNVSSIHIAGKWFIRNC